MLGDETHRYLIAFGSNQRHHRHGSPRQLIDAAVDALRDAGVEIQAVAPVIETAPLGPSARRFCNGAAVVETRLDPEGLLGVAKNIERKFGRRSGGQAWRARVIDIDIVLWGGGVWSSDVLIVPHPRFRERSFVLQPVKAIAPEWRDPLTGLSVKQLHARLTKPRPATR